jgi:hypothetical protein
MNLLGNLLHARGLTQPRFIAGRGPNKARERELNEGAQLLRESLDASRAVHGAQHLETLISASNLGSALRSLGGERNDRAMGDEASALIKEAVEGIADAWAGDLERQPRARAMVKSGLQDVLQDENGSRGLLHDEKGALERGLEAAGAFIRGLLSTAHTSDKERQAPKDFATKLGSNRLVRPSNSLAA